MLQVELGIRVPRGKGHLKPFWKSSDVVPAYWCPSVGETAHCHASVWNTSAPCSNSWHSKKKQGKSGADVRRQNLRDCRLTCSDSIRVRELVWYIITCESCYAEVNSSETAKRNRDRPRTWGLRSIAARTPATLAIDHCHDQQLSHSHFSLSSFLSHLLPGGHFIRG